MRNKKYPYYSVPEPNDLKDLLNFCALSYKDKTAFWYKKKGVETHKSFIDVRDDVNALCTYLDTLNLNNAHIAILGENSYEWIISYFAIVNGGNVVVPVDKELDAETIDGLLKKTDVSMLIHSDSYSEEAEKCDVKTLNMKDFAKYLSEGFCLIENGRTDYLTREIDREKMCAIVFTSGTTAEPKGVMLNHRSLIRDAIRSAQNLYAPEGTVSVLPLYHTFGFMSCVLDQMILGHGVYVIGSLKRVMADIKYAKSRHISVVPMLISAIYNSIWDNARKSGKEKQLKVTIKFSNALFKIGIDIRRKLFKDIYDSFGGNLEMLISGGSAIDEKYIKGFRDFGIKLTNGYGITECSPIVATMRNKHYAPGSVGCVHPGTQCRIVDGEIQLKGETLFIGYYKDETATKEAFDGDWFKTGDLGYIDNDGLLYITGRKKNLIILSNGKNVAPEELETKVSDFPEVKEVLVYGENDRIVAEIFTDVPDAESSIKEKIAALNRQLSSFKQIAVTRFRNSEFPKTATKKIKRNYTEEEKCLKN